MSLLDRIAGRRAYLDANVFIYGVEEVEPWVRVVQPVIEGLGTGIVDGVTSEITVAEVLVRPLRENDETGLRAFGRAVRSHGDLAVAPVTRAVLVGAAALRAADPALKLPDAIHAATARQSGCGVLVTNDDRLGRASVPGVEVLRLAEVRRH